MGPQRPTLPDLPIIASREIIVDALRSNNTLILQAPTGSGKSTQVPQFLLDHLNLTGEILVLQPRRIAARMLAHRVAWERGSLPGEEIGFQTRFERAVSERTRLRFITEGILPRMMTGAPDLPSISAIVFDEFHERSITVDLGLGFARLLHRTRRLDLKLIVMSATLEAGPLREYLPHATVVSVQGRIHPIEVRYASGGNDLPPWEQAAQGVASLIKGGADGDILVFMPGSYEIRRTIESIERISMGEPVRLVPLHGDLPPESQQRAMEPSEKRRILVATNIAETSLTIPGVRHVVDSGLARISRYDPSRGFTTLYVEQIGSDAADQRAGRAGREGPGICLRMWTRRSHPGRPSRTAPEISRVDLAETVLSLSMLGFTDPRLFTWLESPSDAMVQTACDVLDDLGARDRSTGALTPTGWEMGKLPVHPRLARLILEAAAGGVPRLGALVAAVLSERPALTGRPESCDTAGPTSDFLALAQVLEKARECNYDQGVCARLRLQGAAGRRIERTHAYFVQLLRRQGMHTRDTADDPATALGKAVLLAYPDHLAHRRDQGTLVCDLRGGRRGELSAASCVRQCPLLIATEIRETRATDKTVRVVISLASEVRIEWLKELFADSWTTTSGLEWDPTRKAVAQRTGTRCLGVVIGEQTGAPPDLEAASDFLAATILDKGLALGGWTTEVQDFIARVQWTSNNFPEYQLPAFSEEDRRLLIHELCAGEIAYHRVKDKPALPLVRSLLSSEQIRLVGEVAPEAVVLPSGRRLRITYSPGQPPRARARIQDLYGLRQSPRVARGRATVQIEVLAPNMRPVQITDDLESFWNNHYPEIKKGLARRYPKHEWR